MRTIVNAVVAVGGLIFAASCFAHAGRLLAAERAERRDFDAWTSELVTR